MGNWHGNPELVWHRQRLVSNSLRQAYWEGMVLDIAEIPAEVLEKIQESRRASGEMACKLCQLEYRKHPGYPYAIDKDGGGSYLHELCNGDLVKL